MQPSNVKQAREAGATDQVLTEVATVAATMRAGAAITHATHMFKEHL
jgi:alkylhydroperoxidase/carboxymuconolactone decarboxylase family protein YurZ